MADDRREARTVPPPPDARRRPVPRPDHRAELPRAAPVHEDTRPGSPAPPPSDGGKRSYSPPPWASPGERAATDAMAESRRERVVEPAPAQPAKPWVEPPWWHTPGGMVRVLGAVFAGLATLGVGGWIAAKVPTAKPPDDVDHLGELRGDVGRLRDRVQSCEREADELRIEQRRQTRRTEQLQTEIYELKQRTPRIEAITQPARP